MELLHPSSLTVSGHVNILQTLSDEEAVKLVRKTLLFYIKTAKYKTRTARFTERTTINELKAGVGL